MDDRSSRLSSFLALVPLLVLILLLFVSIRIFGSDALEGSSQIVLLVATAICVGIALLVYKIPWKTLEMAMVNNITCVATAIIILLIIGALSGSWMIGGIIPTLIYYGIQIIHPDYFLVSTCIICAIISVMTGSSWTTIATIGIALLGIGQAQGFAPGWVAGAIISGAIPLLHELEPQLVFLDVEMPFGNAFDVLDGCRDIYFETIFVTAYSEYSLRALNQSAAYYLLKPVSIEELILAVNKVQQHIVNREVFNRNKILVENLREPKLEKQQVILPTLEGFEVVKMEQIVRLQGNGNFTDIYLTDKSKKNGLPFSEIFQ